MDNQKKVRVGVTWFIEKTVSIACQVFLHQGESTGIPSMQYGCPCETWFQLQVLVTLLGKK